MTIQLHKQKDGFKETWELVLYWKSQPVKNFKYGIESRIWSVGQDDSQSWVRIPNGTIKYVVDSNQDNTEIPIDPQEDQVPQTSTKVVAARSKAKAKTTTERTCWYNSNHTDARKKMDWILSHRNKLSLRTISQRKWSVFFDTIKRYSGKKMEQFNSGELNFIFEIILQKYSIGLMIVGNLGSRRRFEKEISVLLW